MKDKMQKNVKFGNFSGKILLDMLICPVILFAALFLPYASYSYKNIRYDVDGFAFIVGRTVAGGRAVIESNPVLIVALAACLVIIAAAAAVRWIGLKAGAGIIAVCGIINAAAHVYLSMQLSGLMEGAKNVRIYYGSVISLVLSLVIIVRGVYLLHRLKVVSALDFMVLPGLIYFIINNYIPMVGITLAFKKIDYSVGLFQSPWAGFENFKLLFANTGSFFKSTAFIITRNTLLYNIVFIVLGIITGIVAGICLADVCRKALQKFFQTSILLPQLISMVIVAYIVFALLSNETGMVNKLLGEGNEIPFYSTPKYWPFILTFVYLWKQLGYNAIIFLSSIVGIDKSLYEAARVDGASRWQQITRITLPLLKPTVITLFLLSVGRIFYSDFGLFYQVPMDSGLLLNVTNTIDTYVYRCLMVSNNLSVSSAASTYQAIVGFILVLGVNMIVRRVDRESAMF